MEQNNTGKKMVREVMKLTFDSLSENEEFARVVVAVFATRMNPTLEEIDDIKTAVSEAVTNAVIHGYQNGEGIIYIEAAVEENVLSITVSDDGIGFLISKKRWSRCSAHVRMRDLEWAFLLWRHLWTVWRLFLHSEREPL